MAVKINRKMEMKDRHMIFIASGIMNIVAGCLLFADGIDLISSSILSPGSIFSMMIGVAGIIIGALVIAYGLKQKKIR